MITSAPAPIYGENGHYYDLDLFYATLSLEELTTRYGVEWIQVDVDGLGVADLGWINFNGHRVRLMHYQDGPEDFAKQVSFAFPNKTPELGKLKDELVQELGVTPKWVTSLI